MKKNGIKILFHLFSFLSDRTNGFSPFVKYKLMSGALLVGIGTTSCNKINAAVTQDNNKQDNRETDMCYKPVVSIIPADDTISSSTGNSAEVTEITPIPDVEEIPMIMCYEPAVPADPDSRQIPEEVFTTVEEMPSFPGGADALLEFIRNNLQYPQNAPCATGNVILRFIVGKDGAVRDIQIIQSLAPQFDKEAVRVAQLMPKWVPGKQNGKSVSVYYTIPIKFRLTN